MSSNDLHCPYRLPYEDVKDACKANGFICNAPWANGTGTICGRPLGAHPRERDLGPQPASEPLMMHLFDLIENNCAGGVLVPVNINFLTSKVVFRKG
jgi:hypothetical protein